MFTTAPVTTWASTGCMRPWEGMNTSSSRAMGRMDEGGMPSSSSVSRRAHWVGDSPSSIRPPGKQTSPGCRRRASDRTSKSRWSFPFHSTTGTSTA